MTHPKKGEIVEGVFYSTHTHKKIRKVLVLLKETGKVNTILWCLL